MSPEERQEEYVARGPGDDPQLPDPQEAAGPAPGGEPGLTGAEPEDDQAAELDPTQLVADLAKAQEDLASLTGDLQRVQAEYLNYKRRVDRDRELVKENARFQVLSDLLPVLDDIDRARDAGELEGGFKAVADALERVVAGLGLTKFGRPGDPFDPNLHEALMHSYAKGVATTTCQTIVQAGYRIGDRVVRAARVTVVDPEPEDQPEPAQAQADEQGERPAEPGAAADGGDPDPAQT